MNGEMTMLKKNFRQMAVAQIVSAMTVILCLLIDRKLPLPVQDFSKNKKDEELSDIKFVKDTLHPLKMNMMSNSFAFGGNNTCVIIGENNE